MTDYLAIGNFEHLKEGWAIIPFVQKPHYWKEVDTGSLPQIYKGKRVRFYKSLCGVEAETYEGKSALVKGNFPRCKRCQRCSLPKG